MGDQDAGCFLACFTREKCLSPRILRHISCLTQTLGPIAVLFGIGIPPNNHGTPLSWTTLPILWGLQASGITRGWRISTGFLIGRESNLLSTQPSCVAPIFRSLSKLFFPENQTLDFNSLPIGDSVVPLITCANISSWSSPGYVTEYFEAPYVTHDIVCCECQAKQHWVQHLGVPLTSCNLLDGVMPWERKQELEM